VRQQSFFAELQRRHVYKVGAAYAVAGWLLVQVATQVFPFFDVPNVAVRWVVIAAAGGFPLALVLAWLFDITPAGIVRTEDAPVSDETPVAASEGSRTDRKLNYVLGTLVVLGFLYLIAERTVLRGALMPAATAAAGEAPAPPAGGKSIAVLPLANTGGDPANEYFSDGLSEELISVLAKIPDLRVIGRSSSFHFKGSNEDSRGIGEKLGVTHLLEGSVRRQGDRVRIVAELVSSRDGHQLWSETYDRELKDVFAVQSEIAVAVAAQLKLTLLGGLAAPKATSATQNLQAYNALLKGDFFRASLTPEDQLKASSYYEQATQLDPSYALAYARLSRTWRTLAAVWLKGEEAPDGFARARTAAQRSVQLAPDLGEAHQALGWLLATPGLDFPAAEVEMRRALALGPADMNAKNSLANMLRAEGHLNEAEQLFREASVLEPLAIAPKVNRAQVLISLNRLDEAEAELRESSALQPQGLHQHLYFVEIDLLRGDAAAALRHAQMEQAGIWRDLETALALQAQPDRAAANAALREFAAKNAKGGAFQVAELYAYRKEPEAMFEWLDRAVSTNDSGLAHLMSAPFLAPYRTDSRFIALCRKLKIDLAVQPRLP